MKRLRHIIKLVGRNTKKIIKEAFKFALMVSLIFLIWSYSFSLIARQDDLKKISGLSLDDLSALLFGASSIALFMVSIVLAILTIFGWQAIIRGEIKQEVSRTTDRKIQQVEHEMRGRVLNALGYMVGEMWPQEKGKLEEAVVLLRQGYDEYLSKVEGPARFLGLNNLLYYSLLYYSCVPPKREEVRYMLKNARILLDKGLENDSIYPQLTASRVILEYSNHPHDMERIGDILRELKDDPRLSNAQQKELELLNQLAGGPSSEDKEGEKAEVQGDRKAERKAQNQKGKRPPTRI